MKYSLLFISIICLIGCDLWKEVDNSESYEPTILDTYVGVAVVKMECGDICTDARIEAKEDVLGWRNFYPDSTGNILVELRLIHSDEFDDIEWFSVIAYIVNNNSDIFQVTPMWFKNDLTEEDIPITEIIFPDSLAIN